MINNVLENIMFITLAIAVVSSLANGYFYLKYETILEQIQNTSKKDLEVFDHNNAYDVQIKNRVDSLDKKQTVEFLMNWSELETLNPMSQEKIMNRIELKRRMFRRTTRNTYSMKIKEMLNTITPFKKYLSEDCQNDLITARVNLIGAIGKELSPAILTKEESVVMKELEIELDNCSNHYNFLKNISSINNHKEMINYLSYRSPMDIKYFNNPPFEFIDAALRSNGSAILQLQVTPTHEMWNIAITAKPTLIGSVKEPSLALITLAVQTDPFCIDLIPQHQTIELCLFALEKNPKAYSSIKIVPNPNYETTLTNLLKKKAIMESL